MTAARNLRCWAMLLVVCLWWAGSPSFPARCPAASSRAVDVGYSHQTAYASPDDQLDRLQELFYKTLEACRVGFSGQSGFLQAFRPGSGYPQVWVRDAATQIPATRFYYPQVYLTSWIEEFLSCQEEDGGLYDWVAPGAAINYLTGAPQARSVYPQVVSADKNTNMTDQEASAVDAAYQAAMITGDRAWLAKPIKGKTLVEPLDLSLEYVLKKRFDPELGLVKSGYSASWGDVTPKELGQRAIYLSDETPQVAALYTNAFYYHATVEMAALYQMLGQTAQAEHWRQVAAGLKDSINKHLWQEDRGFYRTHRILTPALAAGFPDDSDIFDMPGNASAALYGAADDRQARRIFAVAEGRQHQFAMPTVGGVLLPPYPNGFFRHDCCNQEFVYINGGQWDWFSGRLLQAEFERGDSRRAYRQLLEIARQAVENGGLFEWYSKDGKGKGSPNYGDNAGTLAGAVFQGLYGIYWGGGTMNLRIRLGDQSGKIHLYQPATDTYVAYQYGYDRSVAKVNVDYRSNFSGDGDVSFLLPENRRAQRLFLDGREKSFTVEQVGDEVYVSTSTDWKPHGLEAILK